MVTPKTGQVIDADAHVVETARAWEYMATHSFNSGQVSGLEGVDGRTMEI